MFYLLCFKPRNFFTCDSAQAVNNLISTIISEGVQPEDIEIVNCCNAEIRYDVESFQNEFSGEL